MAQGGEVARPAAVDAELGVAGAAQLGGDVHINPIVFDHHLAARRDGGLYVLRCFQLGAVYGDSGVFARGPRPGAGRGDELLVVLLEDPGAVFDTSSNVARQPSPVAGRAEELLGVLGGAPGAVFDSSGNFARETRPEPGHGDELLGLLLEKSGSFSREPLAGAGRAAEGIVDSLRDSNLGTVVGSAGTMAEHLRRCLPVVGILASSMAVTGVAGGSASPAAGFGFLALLLGGLSLVILHVRRA